MTKYIKPELLAPAGTFECLKTAFYFGADAVYLAGKSFGLRAFAANFDNDELKQAVEYAHNLGKKIHVTVNSVIRNTQMDELKDYLMFLAQIGVDAVIVCDPAIIKIIRDNNINLEMHLSTQTNTFNYMSCLFWHELGVKRVVLSRELTMEDIECICKNVPKSLEIETFVHGAMCVAHSGRCLLSAALTGRSGNKGACAQPCRWEYYLYEKGYEGEYFPISEDEHGTYILNSKDLMMIEHVDRLMQAGITSFKIEGRMKSPYYVASVVNAYRRAIDSVMEQGDSYVFDEHLKEELIKSATRQFSTGFYFNKPRQDIDKCFKERPYAFVGIVTEDAQDGMVKIEQRNKFWAGDTIEVISPNLTNASFVAHKIINEDGEEQESAPHPQQKLTISCNLPLKKGDILRKML